MPYSSFSIFASKPYLLVANLGDKGPVLRYDLGSGKFMGAFFPVERPDPQFGSIDAAPYDIQKSPDGWLHVLTLNPREVWRFRESNGALGSVVVPDLQKKDDWRQSFCLAFGPDGNLYVSTNNGIHGAGSEVLRFDAKTGTPMGMFVPTKSGGLQGGNCIVFGPDGNLYAAGDEMDGILRFNGTTGAFMGTFVTAYPHGNMVNPRGLAFGPDGNLYAIATSPREASNQANSTEPDRILRYHGSTGALLGEFVSPSAELGRPISIVFGPDGNLYVGTTHVVGAHGTGSIYTGRIRVYNGNTGSFLGVLDFYNQAQLDYPISMAFARIPTSIRDIIFRSHIPRWMWAIGFGFVIGVLAGQRSRPAIR